MAGRESTVTIGGWRGINLSEPAPFIRDDELVTGLNINLGRAGEAVKRNGFNKLGVSIGANPVQLIGYFHTSSVSQLIAKSGATLYYSTDAGVTWTAITGVAGDFEYGVQYINQFYVVRSGGTLVKWDGTTATEITGSPQGTFCFVYKDRLFILSTVSATLNSRLYFSEPADFSSSGFPANNFLDVATSDADPLMGAAILDDNLFLFKSQSIHFFGAIGDPTEWILRIFNPTIGCVSKNTIRVTDKWIYFVGPQDIYRTNGMSVDSISKNLAPVLADRLFSISKFNLDSAAWWEGKYICVLGIDTDPTTWSALTSQSWSQFGTENWGSDSEKIYVFHENTEGWSEWQISNSDFKLFSFLEIRTTVDPRGLFAGCSTNLGFVYKLNPESYSDQGVQFPVILQTKEFALELPSNMKRGKFLVVEQMGGSSLDKYINYADGIPVEDTISIEEASHQMRAYKIKGPGFFRLWQFRVEHNSGFPMKFFRVTMHMNIKAKISKVA